MTKGERGKVLLSHHIEMSVLNANNYTDMTVWQNYPLVFKTILYSGDVSDSYQNMVDVLWGSDETYGPHGSTRTAVYLAKQKTYEREKKKMMSDLKVFFPKLCKQWGVLIDMVLTFRENNRETVEKWWDNYGRNV